MGGYTTVGVFNIGTLLLVTKNWPWIIPFECAISFLFNQSIIFFTALAKYVKMIRVGVPVGAVALRMRLAGLNPDLIQCVPFALNKPWWFAIFFCKIYKNNAWYCNQIIKNTKGNLERSRWSWICIWKQTCRFILIIILIITIIIKTDLKQIEIT